MITAALTALALSLPHQAVVVPGKSFAGLRLGATGLQVTAAWGRSHGRCRDCPQPTWYFTYRKFAPQGAAVSFRNGAVESFFTLWAPPGWHTDRGLAIGDPEPRVTQLYGALPRFQCVTYAALILRRGRTATLFYVYRGKVWGFGLSPAGAPPCH